MQTIKTTAVVAFALLLWTGQPTLANMPWGAEYFPNVPLVNHHGEKVHFFDDLIKDKVVAINFIYTVCPETCPLETARLAKVQRLLGDRVGKDIFMYSITIDPENDTPEVLAKYAERYQAQPGWTFLTGKEEDITLLRRKLGLYIEEIQDGSNNHNVNLIIGNQTTGKWLKRSPFENPYVLAEQIENWLVDWTGPPEIEFDYAEAPEVRNISQGEYLFRTRCATCHTVGKGNDGLAPGLEGPDLLGVNQRRERTWLERWIAEPDKMLEEGDPIALGLFAQYNEIPMPNMRLSPQDVEDLLQYLGSESRQVQMERARQRRRERRGQTQIASVSGAAAYTEDSPVDTHANHAAQEMEHSEHDTHATHEDHGGTTPKGDAVALMNAWVRVAHPEATTNAGYMTLINIGSEDVTLVGLESPAFEKVEIHEMATVDGLMKMRRLDEVVIPAAGGQARFEPGGRHLMLINPVRHLSVGESIELTLKLASGLEQPVSIRVADR